MAENSDHTDTGSTVFALKVVSDQYVSECPEMSFEDDTTHQMNMHLTSFKTVLSQVEELKYDKTMISKLIEFNTKLIAKGQHKKISDLEARAVLLQRELHDYDFLYSKGDTAEPEHTSKGNKTGNAKDNNWWCSGFPYLPL